MAVSSDAKTARIVVVHGTVPTASQDPGTITLTDQVPMAQGIYNCPSDAIANQSHYTHHNCIRVNAAIDHLYENSDT